MKTVNFLIFAMIFGLELVKFSKGYHVDERLTVDSGNTKYGIVTKLSSDLTLFVTMDDVQVSTLNDVPALTDIENVYNMVMVTNSESTLELAIQPATDFNPIRIGNRFDKVEKCRLNWNLGCLPQTWQNLVGAIRVLEIGGSKLSPGSVVRVKVFSAVYFPLAKSWVMVAIAVRDSKSAFVNHMMDLQKHYPELESTFLVFLNETDRQWSLSNASSTHGIIWKHHIIWKRAMERSEKNVDGLSCSNVRLGNNKTTVTGKFQLSEADDLPLAPIQHLNEISPRYTGGTCVICLSESSTHACIPCGHKVLCSECSSSAITRCPICQTEILMVVKIFDNV